MTDCSTASAKQIVYYHCLDDAECTNELQEQQDSCDEKQFYEFKESQVVNELAQEEDTTTPEVYLSSNKIELNGDYATVKEEPPIDEYDSTISCQDWLSSADAYPLNDYSVEEKLLKLKDFELIEMKPDDPPFGQSLVGSHNGLADEKLSSKVFIKPEKLDFDRNNPTGSLSLWKSSVGSHYDLADEKLSLKCLIKIKKLDSASCVKISVGERRCKAGQNYTDCQQPDGKHWNSTSNVEQIEKQKSPSNKMRKKNNVQDKLRNNKATRKPEKPREKGFCDHCKKWFSSRDSLRMHIRSLTNEKHFQCVNCGMLYKRADYLRRHMRIHTDEKDTAGTHTSYTCSDCGKSYSRSDRLKLHIRDWHCDKNPVIFPCSFPNCYRICNRADVLALHLKSHTGEKPYICSYCEWKCAELSNLKAHVRIHTGEQPFRCQYCKLSFRLSPQLHAHVWKIHKGERPFKCDECDKTFLRKADLKLHLSSHGHLKKFLCADCNKTFAGSGELKIHVRQHTKGKISNPRTSV